MIAISIAPMAGYAGILDHVQGLVSSEPPTLTQVARMIDCIQSQILNQGTVVIKQPDIWSQARMTKFRKEFEDTMAPELSNFGDYLSGQLARSDSAALSSQTALGASLVPGKEATTVNMSPLGPVPQFAPAANFNLLNAVAPSAVVPGASAKGTVTPNPLPLSVEPNVHLDEKADYISHLHRLRRVNLGDDTADSAGYGLYLMRVPVSIQPGDKTVKGYGAIVNISMQHDFNPKFLPDTYRNLVINDVVDLLSPVVYELIRSGQAKLYQEAVSEPDQLTFGRSLALASSLPNGRTGPRTFAIAPSDVKRVFVEQNLLNLAYAVQVGLDMGTLNHPATIKVKLAQVGSFLRQELEGAFDLMEGRCHESPPILMDVDYIEKLTDQVYSRKFEGPKGAHVDSREELNDFYRLYEGFAHRLPGNLRFRPVGVLCWAIAVEAGLLNRQLREDMKDTKDLEGNACPFNVDELYFYQPIPAPEAVAAFQAYVKARWPMITFALEPVTDQQNIEDAYSRQRSLQLAIAFALSSGQITFNQALNYNRTLQYEAQTIMLNQTISAFAHGNDTFGWRIRPRFQNPPDESNLRAVTNLLLYGGPGPNYGLKNAKIEPGLREMTAVVVMPSFVRGLKLDAANNWFRLNDPDDFKLHTARAVELGRRINEARAALDMAGKCGLYRAEDVERLRARLHQLEAMLPLQSARVKVPYENTLGGFALFTQGATALIPELTGYEGVDYLDTSKYTDILVYGKHFSLYETAVVIGGVTLPRLGLEQVAAGTGKGNIQNLTLTNLKNPNGNIVLVGADGVTPIEVKDLGSYDILSREVLRLHIPPNVQTTTLEDNTVVVDLYVSTPNGISNKVHIPVNTGAGSSVQAAGGSPAYVLADDTLTIPVTVHLASGKYTYDNPPAPIAPGVQIRVVPLNPVDVMPPSIDMTVQFDTPSVYGLLTEKISGIPWDGKAYTIDSGHLTTFANDVVNVLMTNTMLPTPTSATTGITNPFLTSKAIKIDTGLPGGTSTTAGPLKINIQPTLVPGTAAAAAASATPAATTPAASPAATTPAAPKASGTSSRVPAPSSALAQASAHAGIPLPKTRGAKLDPLTRPAAVEDAVPAALDLPELVPASLSAQIESLTAQVKALNEKTATQVQTANDKAAAQIQALNEKTADLAARVNTALNVPNGLLQVPPVINVAVPVTNVPQPVTPRRGLFHRRGATPQNPTRPPLIQRLMSP
jgi:hypothetical protein